MENIGKTQKERRAESDARIISSAIKCFGKCGYTNTSLIHIAENAGVTAALISQRFETKENLFTEAYFHIIEGYVFDLALSASPRECLAAFLTHIKKIEKESPESFEFCCMIYKSSDIPEEPINKFLARQKQSNIYKVLLQAQKDGVLPAGNLDCLLSAFSANVFTHIQLCRKYNFEIPKDDYYLKTINFIDEENKGKGNCGFYSHKTYVNEQLMEITCKNLQSLWLINTKDKSLNVIKMNNTKAIPGSVASASKIRIYDDVRFWYAKNYIVESSREKFLQQTEFDYVMSKIKGDETFFVEYGRQNGKHINFNQLSFDKIENPETKEIDYIAMGLRDVDISKRVEIDDLTGLLNRQSFFARAEEMLVKNPGKQFDVVLSDIVDYKKINETYGSDVADEVLRWHGRYLSSLANDRMLIGRYGGDQMVLIGEHNYIHQCLSPEYRERFLEAERNNGLPSVKFKYGIYLDIKTETSIISICDKAHMALNSIKSHYSKEIAYYTKDIKRHLERQRIIEECMYSSLENGDFKVYYQPKHDVRTGRLSGAEALIRWINPKYGFMSPADFIPLFEQNGFIMEIDKFVGYKTCENLRKWMDKGINVVPISINASMLTIFREDLISDIRNSIESFGLKPGQLHMEITETLMTENIEKLVVILNELRALGCKVELDDFGSGYSSLNVLSEFPIDILKLDMSFMQEFGDKKRTIVLESCIDMAKKLGFETVSEGVELEEQTELLKKLGADMIQGYFYSKPLSEEEFEKYMLENQ